MTPERALEINTLVVGAWLSREGLSNGKLPDLSGITLGEAISASEAVAAMPPVRNPDGSTTMTCHVATPRIPALYGWAVATTALERICKEHAST